MLGPIVSEIYSSRCLLDKFHESFRDRKLLLSFTNRKNNTTAITTKSCICSQKESSHGRSIKPFNHNKQVALVRVNRSSNHSNSEKVFNPSELDFISDEFHASIKDTATDYHHISLFQSSKLNHQRRLLSSAIIHHLVCHPDARAPLKELISSGRVMSTSSGSKSEETTEKSKPKFSKTKEELRATLTPLEYKVTQEKDTERPFTGKYNDFKEKGTYHCVVCEEELFSSDTKFESGCGWPSFFDSIDKSKIKYVKDFSLVGANILLLAKNPNLVRTEILCANCDAHLGHVFDDGPKPSKKRYCVNSASLRFTRASSTDSAVPSEKL